MNGADKLEDLEQVKSFLDELVSKTAELEADLADMHAGECPPGTSCPWCGPVRQALHLLSGAYLDVHRTIERRARGAR